MAAQGGELVTMCGRRVLELAECVRAMYGVSDDKTVSHWLWQAQLSEENLRILRRPGS